MITMTEYLKSIKGINYRTFKNKPKFKRDKLRQEYNSYIEENKDNLNKKSDGKSKNTHKIVYQTDDYIVEIEEN